jgi:hypothetical protein
MSRTYKTIRGKSIDIDKLKLVNENTVAVSNMKVNARGDLLGPKNEVAVSRNQLMDQVYAVDQGSYSPNDPSTYKAQQDRVTEANLQKLNDLAQSLTPAAPAPAAPVTPTARGNLASTVTKKKDAAAGE